MRAVVDRAGAPRFEAGGGTNIPSGLSLGLRTLGEAEQGRVRRVVLVSDGLDSTRAQAERLASDSAERGITVSSMGIGLDFDEAYMRAPSRATNFHGNFAASVERRRGRSRPSSTASSTRASIHHRSRATVRLSLPKGIHFVRANGEDATDRTARLGREPSSGRLFAGDERRARSSS